MGKGEFKRLSLTDDLCRMMFADMISVDTIDDLDSLGISGGASTSSSCSPSLSSPGQRHHRDRDNRDNRGRAAVGGNAHIRRADDVDVHICTTWHQKEHRQSTAEASPVDYRRDHRDRLGRIDTAMVIIEGMERSLSEDD